MFSKNMKMIMIIAMLFVISLSTIMLYADCEMMAMIAKKENYISWLDTQPNDWDDPYDFFQFMRDESHQGWVGSSSPNDDGYGVVYYPEDGSLYFNEDDYDDVLNQVWYKTSRDFENDANDDPVWHYPGNGWTWYGDTNSHWEWDDDEPLFPITGIIESTIMDNSTEASIVLGHDRQGTGGNGNYPFRIDYTDPITQEITYYTFMHNGNVGSYKDEFYEETELIDSNWFSTHDSNWDGIPYDPEDDDWIDTWIDSELYFHYIVANIHDSNNADGDIIQGIYNALSNPDLNNGLDIIGSDAHANFIMSDGISIYAYRCTNDPDYDLKYVENDEFWGITSGTTSGTQLGVDHLAILTPYGDVETINLVDPIEFKSGTIAQSTTWDSEVLITDNITVPAGVTLNIDAEATFVSHSAFTINGTVNLQDDSNFKLNHASEVLVENDGLLFLNWGSTITGCTPTTYGATRPGHPVGGERQVLGDRIIAQNGGIITTDNDYLNPGDVITIGSTSSSKWDGIFIRNPSDEANYWFVNCDISGIGRLSIENVGLSARNTANLKLYQTDFHDNSTLLVRGGHELIIDDCEITDNAGGILVYDSPATIENSTITGNGTGVYMNYVGGQNSTIKYCDINDNDGNGFVFRDREIDFRYNNVQNNLYYGIVAYPVGTFSHFLVNGNDYHVSNNGSFEYGGFAESYTWPNCGNNISDAEYITGEDTYLLKVFGWTPGDAQVDVYGNNIDNSDHERFWPSYAAYDFGGIIEDEKIMFDSASDDMNAGNYVAARSTFEQLITDYPESLEAAASLQKIYFIENYTDQNYDDLLLYVESIPTVEGSTMHRVKRDLITKTYMQKEEYNIAINLLETVISDPANEIELTDALIDEAYCYVKLIEEGSRALPEICTFKPQNFDEFLQIVSGLENKLYETEEPIEEEIIPVNVTLSNYPNPFNPTTTINFSLPEDSDVELSIYNVKGQKVITLTNEFLVKGLHSIEWNGKNNNNKSASSGIYFYKISAGKSTTMRKMLLLK
ncbi:MAG: T9SS type A sorting domain-containing protein [FCB group bacterium]|nr:T9SS type A sorting domain-containing protein [FCB group bacterium]